MNCHGQASEGNKTKEHGWWPTLLILADTKKTRPTHPQSDRPTKALLPHPTSLPIWFISARMLSMSIKHNRDRWLKIEFDVTYVNHKLSYWLYLNIPAIPFQHTWFSDCQSVELMVTVFGMYVCMSFYMFVLLGFIDSQWLFRLLLLLNNLSHISQS